MERDHQTLMDQVYNKWQTMSPHEISRLEVIEAYFEPLHKAAVQLGNFNYQVNNGGFEQWYDNGYATEDLDDLIEIFKRGTKQQIKHFDTILSILQDFLEIGDPENYDDIEYYTDTCPICNGTGEVNNDTCINCDGEGETEEEDAIEGFHEFAKLCHPLDMKYYDLDSHEVLASYQEYLNRFDEDISTNDIKLERKTKPIVKLIGQDGNIFNLIGITCNELRKVKLYKEAEELADRLPSCHSYEEALQLIMEYVDVR